MHNYYDNMLIIKIKIYFLLTKNYYIIIYPFNVKTLDFSAISIIFFIISSSNKNVIPDFEDPILPTAQRILFNFNSFFLFKFFIPYFLI